MSGSSPEGIEVPRSGMSHVPRRLARFVARSLGGQGSDEDDVGPALMDSDPWAELRRELGRSRRYQRQFALLCVDCCSSRRDEQLPQDPHALRRRALQLSAFLRSVDRAWFEDGIVYLLFPECDRSNAEAFVSRVRREAPELLPDGRIGLVAFPDDGLTSGALLSALHGRPLTAEGKLWELPHETGHRAVLNLRPTGADDV